MNEVDQEEEDGEVEAAIAEVEAVTEEVGAVTEEVGAVTGKDEADQEKPEDDLDLTEDRGIEIPDRSRGTKSDQNHVIENENVDRARDPNPPKGRDALGGPLVQGKYSYVADMFISKYDFQRIERKIFSPKPKS